MYAPDENGLGGLQLFDDVRECSRFRTEAERDVCMIGKGYQKTAKGYSRSTGISPKAIIGVAAALAVPAILPAVLPAAATALKSVAPAVKAIVAKGTQEAVPGPAAVPVVVSPGPAVPGGIRAAQLEPWILPALLGGSLILLLALRQ